MQYGYAISPEKLEKERAEQEAARAAEAAALEAAIVQISDETFADHPAVLEKRARLAAVTDAIKTAKRIKVKLETNPVPKRIAELRADIARRDGLLRAKEADAVAKGDTELTDIMAERAEMRGAEDLLGSLESGWTQFQAGLMAEAPTETLDELEHEKVVAEELLSRTLYQLKRDRVTGAEERLQSMSADVEALRREREAIRQREEEAMHRRRPRAAAFRARKAAALAGRPMSVEN